MSAPEDAHAHDGKHQGAMHTPDQDAVHAGGAQAHSRDQKAVIAGDANAHSVDEGDMHRRSADAHGSSTAADLAGQSHGATGAHVRESAPGEPDVCQYVIGTPNGGFCR